MKQQRGETSCGLRPSGACWWRDLVLREPEVNKPSAPPLRAVSYLLFLYYSDLPEEFVLPVSNTGTQLFFYLEDTVVAVLVEMVSLQLKTRSV